MLYGFNFCNVVVWLIDRICLERWDLKTLKTSLIVGVRIVEHCMQPVDLSHMQKCTFLWSLYKNCF